MSDLKNQVLHIVACLENGIPSTENEGEQMSGYEYLSDVLDIEYVVNSKAEYLGARVLVAFGGPNIWINTRTGQVEGYWGGDNFAASYYEDRMDIYGALEELWSCR